MPQSKPRPVHGSIAILTNMLIPQVAALNLGMSMAKQGRSYVQTDPNGPPCEHQQVQVTLGRDAQGKGGVTYPYTLSQRCDRAVPGEILLHGENGTAKLYYAEGEVPTRLLEAVMATHLLKGMKEQIEEANAANKGALSITPIADNGHEYAGLLMVTTGPHGASHAFALRSTKAGANLWRLTCQSEQARVVSQLPSVVMPADNLTDPGFVGKLVHHSLYLVELAKTLEFQRVEAEQAHALLPGYLAEMGLTAKNKQMVGAGSEQAGKTRHWIPFGDREIVIKIIDGQFEISMPNEKFPASDKAKMDVILKVHKAFDGMTPGKLIELERQKRQQRLNTPVEEQMETSLSLV